MGQEVGLFEPHEDARDGLISGPDSIAFLSPTKRNRCGVAPLPQAEMVTWIPGSQVLLEVCVMSLSGQL